MIPHTSYIHVGCCIAAAILFAVETVRTKSLTAAGLTVLSVGLIF